MPKDLHDRPPSEAAQDKTAVIYRMVMESHTCPYGIKSVDLLQRRGFEIDDRWLETREETDAFKAEHGVSTTPQIWIEGRRVGGYDDLEVHLGRARPKDQRGETSYQPVIALFSVGALLAVAFTWVVFGTLLTWQTLAWFVSISMVLLGLQKLKDVGSFSTMFLNYDLLGKRWVRYAYAYPWIETGAGLLMTAMVLPWLSVPSALFIGTVGAVSVFKAVYVDKRELKCACVGGDSKVPLGFVSLTENVMMVGMALWMGARALL
jgi:glutaredoxin